MTDEQRVVEVRRLHPVRVLLVSQDRRFLRAAGLLLSRRGYLVEEAEQVAELAQRIERQRTNVVVLDASNSLTIAARAAAAVDALTSRVGIVTVSEYPESTGLQSVDVVPKWEGHRLVEAVEHAYPRTQARESRTVAAG
jgi:DNA-binding NtrC family response regulator